MMDILRINEIFLSIQGESSFAGLPCVFIRTTGCPLRCTWCDTKYAYEEGREIAIADVVDQAISYGTQHVGVTGGEPLAQEATLRLLQMLCDKGKTVLLDTSGALDVSPVDKRVHIIMDIKCPESGMADKMNWQNLQHLRKKDEVKFVLASRRDYEYAVQVIREYNLPQRCSVLLSTVSDQVEKRAVVEWMLADRLPVRFQVQLHKLIWSPDQRGV